MAENGQRLHGTATFKGGEGEKNGGLSLTSKEHSLAFQGHAEPSAAGLGSWRRGPILHFHFLLNGT